MSAVLAQLSVAIGFLLMVIVLIVTTTRGVPITVALFRALVVMCVSSVVMALFFRFFTSVLYRFLAEKVMEQRSRKGSKHREVHATPSSEQAVEAE